MKKNIIDNFAHLKNAKNGTLVTVQGKTFGKIVNKNKKRVMILKRTNMGLLKSTYNLGDKKISLKNISSTTKEFHELTKKYSQYL